MFLQVHVMKRTTCCGKMTPAVCESLSTCHCNIQVQVQEQIDAALNPRGPASSLKHVATSP